MRPEEEKTPRTAMENVRGTRCVGRQNRSARDFAVSRFPQCFPLDDFALRTILKTALNIAMHRSRDVFERSKRAFFCYASDFYALGADLQRKRTGRPLCVRIERWRSRTSWRSSYVRERKRSGANGGLRTSSGQLGIVSQRHADLILAVRLLESQSQAPIPKAGLRRIDPSKKPLPFKRVPMITRRSAPCKERDECS